MRTLTCCRHSLLTPPLRAQRTDLLPDLGQSIELRVITFLRLGD